MTLFMAYGHSPVIQSQVWNTKLGRAAEGNYALPTILCRRKFISISRTPGDAKL